jgi:hypothetical protein
MYRKGDVVVSDPIIRDVGELIKGVSGFVVGVYLGAEPIVFYGMFQGLKMMIWGLNDTEEERMLTQYRDYVSLEESRGNKVARRRAEEERKRKEKEKRKEERKKMEERNRQKDVLVPDNLDVEE